MQTVAGLDNGMQTPLHGRRRAARLAEERPREGEARRRRSSSSRTRRSTSLQAPGTSGPTTPSEVQAILQPFKTVTVIHGHTHQMLTNRIGNIHFHGMLSTAWPWPYAPQGLPQAHRADEPRRSVRPSSTAAATARCDVLADGLVDKIYNLWNRNPVHGERGLPRLRRGGTTGRRARPTSTTEEETMATSAGPLALATAVARRRAGRPRRGAAAPAAARRRGRRRSRSATARAR